MVTSSYLSLKAHLFLFCSHFLNQLSAVTDPPPWHLPWHLPWHRLGANGLSFVFSDLFLLSFFFLPLDLLSSFS
jgi:hypothetical protein